MAVSTTHVSTKPVTGLQIECTARDKTITLDEPKSFGGTDIGMNPVEALLSALGACKCIVVKAFAEAKGIKLHDVAIDLEGDLDSDGFLGKNPDAKIGFSRIVTKYTIKADNTDDEIQAFIEFVEGNCPVSDTIKNTPEMGHEVTVS